MVRVALSGLMVAATAVASAAATSTPATSGLLLPQFLLDPSGGLFAAAPDVFTNVSRPCVDEFQRIHKEYKNQSESSSCRRRNLLTRTCASRKLTRTAFSSPAAKELAFMLLASGKNFPIDAGRYALCTHESSTPNGRYFLVTTALEGGLASQLVPGFSGTVNPELGLCLPNKCSSEDIFQVVNNSAQELLEYSVLYYPDAAVSWCGWSGLGCGRAGWAGLS